MNSADLTFRPSLDETMMSVAETASRRSLCMRMGVGAVITDTDHVVRATSYNGPPANYDGPPCLKESTIMCAPGNGQYAGCPSVHAEQNAILFAGRDACRGGTLYCTATPCADCARIIAQSGITRFVTSDVTDRPGITFLRDCGVTVNTPRTGEQDAPSLHDVIHYAEQNFTSNYLDSGLIALGAVILLAGTGTLAVSGDPLADYNDRQPDKSTGNTVNHSLQAAVKFSYDRFEEWVTRRNDKSNMFYFMKNKDSDDTLRSLGSRILAAME